MIEETTTTGWAENQCCLDSIEFSGRIHQFYRFVFSFPNNPHGVLLALRIATS